MNMRRVRDALSEQVVCLPPLCLVETLTTTQTNVFVVILNINQDIIDCASRMKKLQLYSLTWIWPHAECPNL